MKSINFVVGDKYFATYRITLSGTAYEMTFRFNNRLGRWSMDLLDSTTQVYLWRGLRLMPNNDQSTFTSPKFREEVGTFYMRYNFNHAESLPVSLGNMGDALLKHSLSFTDVEMREELKNKL
jgi:hypothetical protein